MIITNKDISNPQILMLQPFQPSHDHRMTITAWSESTAYSSTSKDKRPDCGGTQRGKWGHFTMKRGDFRIKNGGISPNLAG